MAKHPLPKFLAPAEKQILYTAADNPRDRALISLGLNAGLRVSEIINLKLTDIDWQSFQIRFIAKGGRERIIPLNLRLRLDLSVALEHRPVGLQHDFVIWNKRHPARNVSRFAVYNLIRRYGRKIGLKRPIHPHMLRHTAAVDYYRESHDIYETNRFLGHRRLDTTTRYAQVDDQAITITLGRINRPNFIARLLAQFRAFPPAWLIEHAAGKHALYNGGTIGRQREFALLKQNLEHRQNTVIVSERGGGKSHLLRQL